ncbi:hypothetical protein [Spiroplasma melliferum]|uniref:Uncharacterized protein n=2 Tax=Spiroplasma melliferum TaxID=2134 RepID=A0AAI9X1D7_SPIME|nr:hypothetical protein [Spiroplasma melliferum]KAI93127.1 hypothetical protein SPM_001275 [Spiroplasma melliferum KC3]QCO24311.1 hypothetical protein SRED_002802 [Spiroplasma melliferum]
MEKIINLGDDEIYFQQEREQILEKVKIFYENKLTEKNEYIKFLENRPGNHDCKNCPNRQQLFKEDFEIVCFWSSGEWINGSHCEEPYECYKTNKHIDYYEIVLKRNNNSKYDKLPSKELKKIE